MTVYVTSSELLQLEHARLSLRSEHGLVVDRGRLVREAMALVLADLELNGEASALVRLLNEGDAPGRRSPGRPTGRHPASRCSSTTSRAPSTCCSA